jgi:predicted DsbA family dithiol-disulfide isomerase
LVRPRLLLFADYVCPFCFLAESALEPLRDRGARVERAAFELWPQGAPLPDPSADWLQRSWERAVEPLAAELGVALRYPAFATRTLKAHEAAAFARAEGAFDAMHRALYTAWWRDGRDIGRIDVLTAIAGEVGLDRGAMRVALDIDRWTDRVRQDRELAVRLAVPAVPAYVRLDGGGTGSVHTGVLREDELTAWMTG